MKIAVFALANALLCGGPVAAATCDPATNAQAIVEARQGIERLNNFMSAIERAGLPVPPTLSGAINRLSRAAEMGVDLGEAAGEADYQVQQVVANRHALCDMASPDEDERFICYARVDRQWQARNLDATLNWSNTGSVIHRAVEKWLGSKCDRDEQANNAPFAPVPELTLPQPATQPPPQPRLREPAAQPRVTPDATRSGTPTNSPSTVTGPIRSDRVEAVSPDESAPGQPPTAARAPGGIKINPRSVGRNADLSDIHNKVLQLRESEK